MTQDIAFGPMNPGAQTDASRRISSLDPRLSRTNYFDGRLLKASDLTRDQQYLDERLREVGRVLGSGIAHGLEVRLASDGTLIVDPGLAVAPSGRVLELAGDALSINLFDTALLSELNDGEVNRLRRGLYAVTLQYTETGSDSAEVYPRDLQSERGFHFNAWAEGVELTLTPLQTTLPATQRRPGELSRVPAVQQSLGARAALARELLGHAGQLPEIDEDGIALGVIAIEHGIPLWLDRGLVRRPLRPASADHAYQSDLHAHYAELLAAVLQARHDMGRDQAFAADQYFSLLPPHGYLPKEAVDPVDGVQRFFPEGFEVSIAPVRRDDLASILAESAALAPIDLSRDSDADIMVLVPLSDSSFALRARQLEHNLPPEGASPTLLPHLDRLALRLYSPAPVHRIDTDSATWRAIWSEAGELLHYVRRPPRVAETLVSGVVLARGYALPEPTAPGETPPQDTPPPRLDLASLLDIRKPPDGQSEASAREAVKLLRERPEDERDALAVLLLVPPTYDSALWPTMQRLLENRQLSQLVDVLADNQGRQAPGQLIADKFADLPRALREAWVKLDPTSAAPTEGPERPDRPIPDRPERTLIDLRDPRSVEQLIASRGITDAKTVDAVKQVADSVAAQPEQAKAVSETAQAVNPRYDALLWPTLLRVLEKQTLDDFVKLVREAGPDSSRLGAAVEAAGTALGLTAAQRRAWAQLDPAR